MDSTEASTANREPARRGLGIIDVDVHEVMTSQRDLVPYLGEPWKRYITEYGWTPEKRGPFIQVRKGGRDMLEAYGADGKPPGSDYELMRQQLLDKYNIEHVILTGFTYLGSVHGWYEFAAARASAYNDWLIDNWLSKDQRLHGSIQVAADPEAAVREIDRVASHPQMIQVLLPVSDFTWGEPRFHPIFEAAERHGLKVGMHLSGDIQASGGGFLRYYWAWRSAHPQAYMTQLISLITTGVFDKYPNLQVIMTEGGFEWVPFMMWRMDAAYKGLHQETPWVKRKPSEYIKDNFRFSTQPWHDLEAEHFLHIVDMMGSDELLMFATDYPHWDFENPNRSLPGKIPEDLKRKVLFENARQTYNL